MGVGKYESGYLTKDTSETIKGVFAICVLLSHISGYSKILNDYSLLYFAFYVLGYLSVSVFFFMSGYGLMSSYKLKGNKYIIDFPKMKLLPFCIIYLSVVAIYIGINYFIGRINTIEDIVQVLFLNNSIVINGWYLQVQIFLYILFFVAFYIANRKMLLVLIGCILFILLTALFGLESTIYENVHMFALGFIWKKYEERIYYSFNKRWLSIIIIITLVFLAALKFGNGSIPIIFRIPIKMLSSILFVVILLFLIYKFGFKNNLMLKIGSISFEIYVLQGVFLISYHSSYFYISNSVLYSLAVFFSTIVCAILFHPFVSFVYNRIAK